MTLETADTGKSSTLGTIQNMRFLIAGIELRLQVQVVRNTPFEVLLGRLFFALTECETKDFVSRDQHITLMDPSNRARWCKVVTSVRTYIQIPEMGFSKLRI